MTCGRREARSSNWSPARCKVSESQVCIVASSVRDGEFVEDALEGCGSVGESFRARESERQLRDHQMRLKHREAIVTAPGRLFQHAGNLAVALTGGNIDVPLDIIIFDVQML